MIISSDFFKCFLCNQIKERIKTEIIKNMNFLKTMKLNEFISSTNLNYSFNLNKSIQKINSNQFSNREANQLQVQKIPSNDKYSPNNFFSRDKMNSGNLENKLKNNFENDGISNFDENQVYYYNSNNENINSCQNNGWKFDNQNKCQNYNTWGLNSSGKRNDFQNNCSNIVGWDIDKPINNSKSDLPNDLILNKDFSQKKFFINNDSKSDKQIIQDEFKNIKTFYSSNDKMQIEDENFHEFQKYNRDFYENSCNLNNNHLNRNCFTIDSNAILKEPITDFNLGNNQSTNYFNYNNQLTYNSNLKNLNSEFRNPIDDKLYMNNIFSTQFSLDNNRPNSVHFYDENNNHENPVKNDLNCSGDKEMRILNYKQLTVSEEKNNELINRFIDNPLLKDFKKSHNVKKQLLSSSDSNDFSLLGSRSKMNNIKLNSCKNPPINKNIQSNSKFAKYNISEVEFKKNIESPNISKKLMFIEEKEINQNSQNKNVDIKNSEIISSKSNSKANIENMNPQSLQQNIQNQINFFGFANDFNHLNNNTNNNFINSTNINKLNSSSNSCNRDFDQKCNFNFQSRIFNKDYSNSESFYKNQTKCYLNSVDPNNISASRNSNLKANHSKIKESTNKFINNNNNDFNRSVNNSFFDNEEVRSKVLNESNRSFIDNEF